MSHLLSLVLEPVDQRCRESNPLFWCSVEITFSSGTALCHPKFHGSTSDTPVLLTVTKSFKFRNALGPASWGLASQALSSLTNFITTFEVAHQASASQFGAASLSLSFYSWTMTIVSCAVNLPLMVLFHKQRADERTNGLNSSGLGAALLLSVSFALLACGIGILIPSGELKTYLIVLATFLPFLILHEWQRQWFFTVLRPVVPFFLDFAWLASMLLLDVVIYFSGHFQAIYIYLAWLISGSVISLIGLAIGRTVPQLRQGIEFLRNVRKISAKFIIDGVMSSSALLIIMAFISAMLGLGQAAGIRGALTVLSPLIILGSSIQSVVLPRFYRTYERSRHRYAELFWVYWITMIFVSAAYCAAILIMPVSFGSFLLGASWKPTSDVLLPMCIFAMSRIVVNGPELQLKVPEPDRNLFLARTVDVVLLMAGGIIGATFGLRGAAWGLALGKLAATIPWMVFSRRRFHLMRQID